MNRSQNNLTPVFHQVLTVIEKRTKLNPIKGSDLAILFQITEPKVRQIVHYWRFDMFRPIAANTTYPRGYWMARKPEEWNKTAASLKGRAITLLDGLNEIGRRNFSGQQDLNLFT